MSQAARKCRCWPQMSAARKVAARKRFARKLVARKVVARKCAPASYSVSSYSSRIFNTKTTFAERVAKLSRDDAVLSRLSTTYLILCFDGEVVSSQALLTGIYFLALVALVLLITFYNIKTSTAPSSAQRFHWMLFYALLAQCIAHSLTISIPAIVFGVTQNSPQAPLISMLCVLAGFFNTYANCFIFLLIIKPYRVYSKRVLLSVFKSNKVAEIRPQAAPIQTQTTSEAATIVQVEQPTH
ncbi:unnamed protein product [Bursaphelenchus xylophilus]|uniref:(pine wood nematode) hypothetical protein n=1 Tax=Bursaphelenchus xylophilus TaxID=6326 RepID=A0A7I8XDG9_BURXY|nr:unnamed protein product [Bursaphelenchus xylophilus]CAG9113900.1 unnamed protein product [Bursaphelenchus xylophilus]